MEKSDEELYEISMTPWDLQQQNKKTLLHQDCLIFRSFFWQRLGSKWRLLRKKLHKHINVFHHLFHNECGLWSENQQVKVMDGNEFMQRRRKYVFEPTIKTCLSIGFPISIVDFPNKFGSGWGYGFGDFKVLCYRIGFDGVLRCLVPTFEFGKHGSRRHHIGFD